MNDVILPVASPIQGTQAPQGPKDPDPSSFPISPMPISFLPGINLLGPTVALPVPNRDCLLARHPSDHHPRTPILPHPPQNSLLTTASSWGA